MLDSCMLVREVCSGKPRLQPPQGNISSLPVYWGIVESLHQVERAHKYSDMLADDNEFVASIVAPLERYKPLQNNS